jgi:NAD(P)-dependent dehydrogenase (short-subunit alcohol dehydrogenase family)
MSDVALVCGAGGALGSALVDAFLARGDSVVGVDRKAAPREGLQSESADLTDADAVEALWERIETPRWVVNAVGGFRGGNVVEAEPDAVRFLLDLNFATTFWSCRAAARRLERGGAIVNIAARAAVTGGMGAAAYAASKAAVVRLSEVLAGELSGRGIRVNALLPLLIDTPANRAALPPERLEGAVPPQRIADVCAWLCSDAADAVTGAAIPV